MKHVKTDASAAPAKARKPKRFSLIRKFRECEDGAAMVEFSMVALPLFMMVGGIMEYSLHFFANSMLDHGVEEVARKVRTNQITSGTHTAQTFKQELCNVGYLKMFKCSDLKVDLRTIGSFRDVGTPLDANGSLDTSDFGYGPGGRVTINVLRVYYEWPTFMAFHKISPHETWADGKRLMMSSKAFRIEP